MTAQPVPERESLSDELLAAESASIQATDEDLLAQGVIPDFAVTMRGYDRMQVDDYIDALQSFLAEAQLRAREAEEELRQLRQEAAARSQGTMTTETPTPEAEPAPSPAVPASREVVEAVAATLRSAEELAAALREEGDRDRQRAREVIAAAEGQARAKAEAIVAAAEAEVARLRTRADAERTRRDAIRRQLADLRSTLGELAEPTSGAIDLREVQEAIATLSTTPPEPTVAPPGSLAEPDAERTTVMRIPR